MDVEGVVLDKHNPSPHTAAAASWKIVPVTPTADRNWAVRRTYVFHSEKIHHIVSWNHWRRPTLDHALLFLARSHTHLRCYSPIKYAGLRPLISDATPPPRCSQGAATDGALENGLFKCDIGTRGAETGAGDGDRDDEQSFMFFFSPNETRNLDLS